MPPYFPGFHFSRLSSFVFHNALLDRELVGKYTSRLFVFALYPSVIMTVVNEIRHRGELGSGRGGERNSPPW